jgi:hypothetical protein
MAGADKQDWRPLLPAGFHDLDQNALRRLCVERFPESVTRPQIMRNLEAAITQINQQAISGEIWIDGSILTEKLIKSRRRGYNVSGIARRVSGSVRNSTATY